MSGVQERPDEQTSLPNWCCPVTSSCLINFSECRIIVDMVCNLTYLASVLGGKKAHPPPYSAETKPEFAGTSKAARLQTVFIHSLFVLSHFYLYELRLFKLFPCLRLTRHAWLALQFEYVLMEVQDPWHVVGRFITCEMSTPPIPSYNRNVAFKLTRSGRKFCSGNGWFIYNVSANDPSFPNICVLSTSSFRQIYTLNSN